MTFSEVQTFLESWGLHFDTPTGDSNDIPYPQVYLRMRDEAKELGGDKLSEFVGDITDTIDGRTYLTALNWKAIEIAWEHRQ